MMQNPWRRWVAPVGDLELPKRRTQSSSAELQPSGSCRRQRLLAKDRYRIVVMGAAAVGKTCIISRLLYERFVTEYQATVEELHCGEYELDGRPLTLDILDTSGMCMSRRLTREEPPVTQLPMINPPDETSPRANASLHISIQGMKKTFPYNELF